MTEISTDADDVQDQLQRLFDTLPDHLIDRIQARLTTDTTALGLSQLVGERPPIIEEENGVVSVAFPQLPMADETPPMVWAGTKRAAHKIVALKRRAKRLYGDARDARDSAARRHTAPNASQLDVAGIITELRGDVQSCVKDALLDAFMQVQN